VPRLFVAIPLPGPVRRKLAGLQAGIPGARWTPEENLHLTLRFIGDCSDAQADDYAEALDSLNLPPFEIVIEGVGRFGDGPRTRLLWAGVRRDEALVHLRRKVESALVRAGAPPDARKFAPHITLARLRDASPGPLQAFLADNAVLRMEPVDVDHFGLYSSLLMPEGAIHTLEAEYPMSFNALPPRGRNRRES